MNEHEELPPPSKLSQSNWLEQELCQRDGGESKNTAWELDLGIKWFSRAGIVMLLVGCAMALNYSWEFLNAILIPEVKIIISSLVAFGLFIAGGRLLNRFQLLGRILQGGGLALGYLSLFGMFFIPAVRIFHDPSLQSLGWGLLLLYVGFMIAMARKMDSRSVAVLSLGFGYYTASYAGTQLVCFVAGSMLGVASLVLGGHKKGWGLLPKVGFAGFVFIYLLWQGSWMIPEQHLLQGLPSHIFSDSADETIYLITNFLLFHMAGFRNRPDSKPATAWGNLSLSVMNTLLVYGLLVFTQGGTLFGFKGMGEAFLCLMQLGTYVAMLRLSADRTDQPLQAHLVMGILFFLLTIFSLMDAHMQPIAISVGALVLGLLSRPEGGQNLYRVLSGLLLVVACLTLATFNWQATSPAVLLFTVGGVSLTGLALERCLFSGLWQELSVTVLIVSSFLFLLSIMVGLEHQWITLGTVLTGFAFLIAGFLSAETKYRWSGLGWIFLAVCRLVTVDLLMLAMPYKILLFLAMGALLLIASYGYNQLARSRCQTGQDTSSSELNLNLPIGGLEGQPVLPDTHHQTKEV